MTAAARATRITSAVAARPRLWWAVTLGFPAVYHLMMFAALVARFQAWPNYAVTYDWLGNVTEIIRATPSLSDMGAIIAQEWLFEVGRMNYDYGNGISEWSLHINPAKVLIICLLGGLVATLTTLVAARRAQCSSARLGGAGAAGGLGAALVGMTNVTLAWVVCCATPNWVVGLAILGLGVSSSLWLEQFGWWIEYAGFVLLLASLYLLSGDPKTAETAHQTAIPQSAMGAPR
ncbi:MAG: hypothetical protein CMM77_05375 [Rhodospirillaceae bacterium]|nr:hypothetical protein [Rhodospirillaceae bacterium]|tara:strand:+ start:1009 stop:1707 length:699 start_codon:yes stop_codon:yes gene_type:complete